VLGARRTDSETGRAYNIERQFIGLQIACHNDSALHKIDDCHQGTIF